MQKKNLNVCNYITVKNILLPTTLAKLISLLVIKIAKGGTEIYKLIE